MEKKELVHVTFSQGGEAEYSKTGVYPENLYFYSELHDKEWKRKVKNVPKEGTLKTDGKVLYSYLFSHEGCEMVGSNGQQVEVAFAHVMCD